MSNLKISVPQPCAKNWEDMELSQKGKFCNSCEKEVTDFTSYRTDELKNYFKSQKGKVCGRFTDLQIVECNQSQHEDSNWKRKIAVVAATAIGSLFVQNTHANSSLAINPKLQVQRYFIKTDNRQHSDLPGDTINVQIFGTIVDKISGLPIPGV